MELELGTLLGWFGGSTVVAIGVSTWISSILSEKIKHEWKVEADKEIEKLKSELDSNNSIISALVGQTGNANQKLLDKRIEVIGVAWRNLLKIKSLVPPDVQLIYTIFSDEELEGNILDHETPRGSARSWLQKVNIIPVAKSFSPLSDEIESFKPFLTNSVSLLMHIYSSVLLRLIYLALNGASSEKYIVWRKDPGTEQLLGSVLNDREMKFLYEESGVHGYLNIIELLETKINNEFGTLISGSRSAIDAITQVKELRKIIIAENMAPDSARQH